MDWCWEGTADRCPAPPEQAWLLTAWHHRRTVIDVFIFTISQLHQWSFRSESLLIVWLSKQTRTPPNFISLESWHWWQHSQDTKLQCLDYLVSYLLVSCKPLIGSHVVIIIWTTIFRLIQFLGKTRATKYFILESWKMCALLLGCYLTIKQ